MKNIHVKVGGKIYLLKQTGDKWEAQMIPEDMPEINLDTQEEVLNFLESKGVEITKNLGFYEFEDGGHCYLIGDGYITCTGEDWFTSTIAEWVETEPENLQQCLNNMGINAEVL